MNTAKNETAHRGNGKNTDVKGAYQLLFNWNDCVAESEKEYFDRLREIKLLRVMREIIETELSEEEKAFLKIRYVGQSSLEETADRLYMSKSSAVRASKRIEEKLGAYMKYVFVYSGTNLKGEDRPLDVKKAIAEIFNENTSRSNPGARLGRSRRERFISVRKTAFCTGIPEERIMQIEEGGNCSLKELTKLITFYGVSADSVILGTE